MSSEDSDGSTAPTPLTPDERMAKVEELRLELEKSFAKKWFPTIVALTVAFVAGVFGFIQQQLTVGATTQATMETKSHNEHEWGFEVVQLYVTRQELFDITKNPEHASKNLQVLAAVAPDVVQSVLNAELSKVPSESAGNGNRINTLTEAASVQSAIAAAKSPGGAAPSLQPSSFTIYLQYPDGGRDNAEKVQALLTRRGYHLLGVEQVRNVPTNLEVRYYRPEQRAIAEGLAKEVGDAIGQPQDKVTAKILLASKPLPAGIMEVWLPK